MEYSFYDNYLLMMTKKSLFVRCLFLLMIMIFSSQAGDPSGFNSAPWGASPDQVKTAVQAQNWQPNPAAVKGFPDKMNVTVFKSSETIAGYKASVVYYFYENKFFQSTVTFNFDDLKKYDFNYNVFRSVDEYYKYIRAKTLSFVNDIYVLLYLKYGKKEPIFKGLDPAHMFVVLDKYLDQERWNHRYNPYDYYQKINTTAYARWDFPKTRVNFSVIINAPQKRFDYQLSLTSLDMDQGVQKKMDSLRMKGL